MVTSRRLATFVHISDLHFGDLDFEGNAAAQEWHYTGLCRGFLGHQAVALDHLEDFFNRTLRKEPDTKLLVTGDLTSFGGTSQFALAQSFLNGYVGIRPGNELGLNAPNALRIPGNHDHWPGIPPVEWPCLPSGDSDTIAPVFVGRPTPAFRHTFPEMPFQVVRYPLADTNLTLVLTGIDTDADVNPEGFWQRLLPVGRFRSQLPLLRRAFGEPNENEIRILLLHHSPMEGYHDIVRGIEEESYWEIRRVIQDCEISVLLTGHFHTPSGEINQAHRGNLEWKVVEARCGTTTVRDSIPRELTQGTQGDRRKDLRVQIIY
ncbi:MAG: metallophosphoesterase [Bryobacterales bacterium]|nr:metallophosphoesterase [Bryobacterales bacterium]